MGNKELAKKFLSDFIQEKSLDPVINNEKYSILPFDDSTKHLFIKIGFNTYTKKDDLSQVWRVEQINGRNVIVAVDSGNIITSNYELFASKDKINVYRGNTYIDSISVEPYTDTSKVLSTLKKESVKYSFLPNELFVEALKKEAKNLANRFIDVTKLLKLSAQNYTEKNIYDLLKFKIVRAIDSYIYALNDILEKLDIYILDLKSNLLDLENKLQEIQDEKEKTKISKDISNIKETIKDIPEYKKFIEENITNISKAKSEFEKKIDEFSSKAKDEIITSSDDLLPIFSSMSDIFVIFSKIPFKQVSLPDLGININLEYLLKSLKDIYNTAILEIKKDISSEEISAILTKKEKKEKKDKKDKKEETNIRQQQKKEEEMEKYSIVVGSIADYLTPPKFTSLTIINFYKEESAKLIKQKFMEIYNTLIMKIPNISVGSFKESDLDKVIREFINSPRSYSFEVPKEWGKLLENVFNPALASAVTGITDYINSSGVDLLSINPLTTYIDTLDKNAFYEILDKIKVDDNDEKLILNVIKKEPKKFYTARTLDMLCQRLIEDSDIRLYFANIQSIVTKFIPALSRFLDGLSAYFNQKVFRKNILRGNIPNFNYNEILKKSKENVLKLVGYYDKNLDQNEKDYVESIVENMIGFTENTKYFAYTMEGILANNEDRFNRAMSEEKDLDKKNDLLVTCHAVNILTNIYLSKYAHSVGSHFLYSVLGNENGCESVVNKIVELIYYETHMKNVHPKPTAVTQESKEMMESLKERILRFLPRAYPRDRELYLLMLTIGSIKNKEGFFVYDFLDKIEEYTKKYGKTGYQGVFKQILRDMFGANLNELSNSWEESKNKFDSIKDMLDELKKETGLEISSGSHQETLGKLINIPNTKDALDLISSLANRLYINHKSHEIFIYFRTKSGKWGYVPIKDFQDDLEKNDGKNYLVSDPFFKNRIQYLQKGLQDIKNELKSDLHSVLSSIIRLYISASTEVSTPDLMRETISQLVDKFSTLKEMIGHADFFGNVLLYENLNVKFANKAFAYPPELGVLPESKLYGYNPDGNLASEAMSRFLGKFQPTGYPLQANMPLTILKKTLVRDDEIYMILLNELKNDSVFSSLYDSFSKVVNGVKHEHVLKWMKSLGPIFDGLYDIVKTKITDQLLLDIIEKKLNYLSEGNINQALEGLSGVKEIEKKEELNYIAEEIKKLKSDILSNLKTKEGLYVIDFIRKRFFDMLMHEAFSVVNLWKVVSAFKHINFPKDSFLAYIIRGLGLTSFINPHLYLLRKLSKKEVNVFEGLTYYDKLSKLLNSVSKILSIGLDSVYSLKKQAFISSANTQIKIAKEFSEEQKKSLEDWKKKLEQNIGNIISIVMATNNIEFLQTNKIQDVLDSLLLRMAERTPLMGLMSYGAIPSSYVVEVFKQQLDVKGLNKLAEVNKEIREKIRVLSKIMQRVVEKLDELINLPYYTPKSITNYLDVVNEKSQVNEIIKGAETSLNRLKREVSEIQSQLTTYVKKLQDLQNEMDSISDETNELYKNLKEKYNEINREYLNLFKEFNIKNRDIKDLESRIAVTKTMLMSLKTINENPNLSDEDKQKQSKSVWEKFFNKSLLTIPVDSAVIKYKAQQPQEIPVHLTEYVSLFSNNMDALFKLIEDEFKVNAERWTRFFYSINTMYQVHAVFMNEAVGRAVSRKSKLFSISNLEGTVLENIISVSGYGEYNRMNRNLSPETINPSLVRTLRETLINEIGKIAGFTEKDILDIFDRAANDKLNKKDKITLLASIIFQKYVFLNSMTEVHYMGRSLSELNEYIRNNMLSELEKIISKKLGYAVQLDENNLDQYKDVLELYLLDLLESKRNLEKKLVPISPMDLATLLKSVLLKKVYTKIKIDKNVLSDKQGTYNLDEVNLPKVEFEEEDKESSLEEKGKGGAGTFSRSKTQIVDQMTKEFEDLLIAARKLAEKWIKQLYGVPHLNNDRLDATIAEIRLAYNFPTSYDFAAAAISAKYKLSAIENEKNPAWVDKYTSISTALIYKHMNENLYNVLTNPSKMEVLKGKSPYIAQIDHYAAKDMVNKFTTNPEYSKHTVNVKLNSLYVKDLHTIDVILSNILEDTANFISNIKSSYIQLVYNTLMTGTYDGISKLFVDSIERVVLPYLFSITKSSSYDFDMTNNSNFVDSRCLSSSFIVSKVMLLISAIYADILNNEKQGNPIKDESYYINYIVNTALPNALSNLSNVISVPNRLKKDLSDIIRNLLTIGLKMALPRFLDTWIIKKYKNLFFKPMLSKNIKDIFRGSMLYFTFYRMSGIDLKSLIAKHLNKIDFSEEDVILEVASANRELISELVSIFSKQINSFIQDYVKSLEKKLNILESFEKELNEKLKNIKK